MKTAVLFICIGFAQSIASFSEPASPECVSKCWDNSKYVSTCVKDTACLCEDANFQSIVLQCLYSQCQTTQFGSALHHALAACPQVELDTFDALPPLIRQQGLRKRGTPGEGRVSGLPMASVSASAAHSLARRSVGASASANYRPTRSIGYSPTHTHHASTPLLTTSLTSTSAVSFESFTAET